LNQQLRSTLDASDGSNSNIHFSHVQYSLPLGHMRRSRYRPLPLPLPPLPVGQALPLVATSSRRMVVRQRRQHFLNFFPLPQGHGSLRPIPFSGLVMGCRISRSRKGCLSYGRNWVMAGWGGRRIEAGDEPARTSRRSDTP
jgi:hypothetical protein